MTVIALRSKTWAERWPFKVPLAGGWTGRHLPALISFFAVAVLACSGGDEDGAPVEAPAPDQATQAAQETLRATDAATPGATLTPSLSPTTPPQSGAAPQTGVTPIEIPVAGRIAFAGLDGGIWVADSGDGSLIQLSPPDEVTGVTGHYAWPGWSPDGTQVSFTSLLPVGANSIEITLMRADSRGDAVPIKIHLDDPASAGIAPGVPHYAGWSPNTGSIALITASAEGPEVVLRESMTGDYSQLLARGGPSYISWAPDSRHLLVHRDRSLFLVSIDDQGRGSAVDEISAAGSLAYRAPVWAPSGEAYIFVGGDPAAPEILFGRVGSSATQSIGPAANNMAFTWSPDGSSLAILAGSTPVLASLKVIEVETLAEIYAAERPVISAWWAPDSRRLAVASPSALTGQVMEWSVLNPYTVAEVEIGILVATSEFAYTQTLFDQFAQTHDLWSPDSQALVLSGAFLDLEDLPEEINDVEPGIWVADAEGLRDPQRIAPGVIAFWSPN